MAAAAPLLFYLLPPRILSSSSSRAHPQALPPPPATPPPTPPRLLRLIRSSSTSSSCSSYSGWADLPADPDLHFGLLHQSIAAVRSSSSSRSRRSPSPAPRRRRRRRIRHRQAPRPRSRHIVNKIMDTLKKHLPVSAPEGLNQLQKIAVLFEEKIYTAATSQSDYLRKISLKMLSMEMKTQQAPGNAQVIPNQNNSAPELPPQGSNQVHTSAIPLISQQQARQRCTSTSVQASSLTNIGQNLPGVNQTSTMQNVSVMPQNTMNNGLAQGTSQDIYAAQRQMAGRQQQQQSQQSIYHQQQMLMKQKLQQNSLMQPHIPQQQYLLQPTQMQSSQQSMMQMSSGLHPGQSTLPQTQPMAMQSATQSGIQQYQLNSVQQSVQSLLQQPQQSMHQQPSLQSQQPNIPLQQQQQAQPSMHQQLSLQSQQPNIPLQQQQQQLMGQQPNLQQNQLIGQQNGVVEMQQQQRLPVQSNNLLNVQQTQQMLNQQYMPFQPQQLGSQANMSSLQQQQQQQQQLRTVPNVSNMQWMHMIQTKAQQRQQQQHAQQPPMGLMQPQSQHNQLQQSQQHLMSQFQSQPNQLQQQLGMQQQFSMQQRLQISGGMLLQQNNMDQQKQFIQAQKGLQEVSSSTSADSTAQSGHAGTGDWQEEIYQMIQSLKDQYFAELSELFNKLSVKLQHVDSIIPPQEPSEKYDRMKSFKIMLDRILQMLQISKSTIEPAMRDKVPQYEKQIISILNSQRRKPVQPQIQQQFQPYAASDQTGHAGAGDWQEEIYQMIQSLKDQYFAKLSELFNKLSLKLQHVDSIVPPQEPSEKYDRMKSFKITLDRILQMLQIRKSTVQPAMRDKIPQYEKQIISILNSQRRKPVQRPI